jgi:hypothetical protein
MSCVLYVPDYPETIGLAAYLKTRFTSLKVVVQSPEQAKQFDLYKGEDAELVVLLGSYWPKINKYAIDKTGSNTLTAVFHPIPKEGIVTLHPRQRGMINIDTMSCKSNLHNMLFKTLEKTMGEPRPATKNSEYAGYLVDLFYERDIVAAKNFIAGIEAILPGNTLYDKFARFFFGGASFEDVEKAGREINNGKQSVADESKSANDL